MDLSRFDRNITNELVDGLLPFMISSESKNMIFKTTGGNPHFITAICRRFQVMSDLLDDRGPDVLKNSIIMEVLDRTGMINGHFEYLLDISLSRFRNKKLYQNILLRLSKNKDNLSGISSAVGKPSGEVSNHMKALLRTDLIGKEGDQYRMVDPLMGTWLSNRYGGDNSFLDIKVRDKVFEDLLESYSGLSTELGRSKEVELRDKLSQKYGMTLKPDDQIEIDLIGEKNGYHIYEIKWRNRLVDIRTMKKFHSKVERSSFSIKDPTPYVISKGGFDKKSMEFASINGIKPLDGSLDELI